MKGSKLYTLDIMNLRHSVCVCMDVYMDICMYLLHI